MCISIRHLVVAASLGFVVACAAEDSSSSSSSIEQKSAQKGKGKKAKGVASRAPVEFAPSNIPLDRLDRTVTKDVTIDTDCVVDTEDGELWCLEDDEYARTEVEQAGGETLAVFVFKSLRIEPGAKLDVHGKRPLAIVSLTDMNVLGEIDLIPEFEPVAGGADHDGTDSSRGGGPGGGGGADGTAGAGGASFCGRGGAGGPEEAYASEGGTPGTPGEPYGNETLVPLVGGSAGGSGRSGLGAWGGGAIQLVAFGALMIGEDGFVNAGGGGGRVNYDGGGSGGAILLEAASVTVEGVLAANGGGGANTREGNPGRPDGIAAAGGSLSDSSGGKGSSATDINGGAGGPGAGGGGGAGRIRINTLPGEAHVDDGTISPEIGRCATLGELRPAAGGRGST